MEKPNDRLQQARKRAGFLGATEAARAFRWNANTYRSHENGERGLKPEAAAKYGRAFRVSTSWILTGEGGPERATWKIINSQLLDGGRIAVMDGEDGRAPYEEIELPVIITAKQTFVTIVLTNEFYPKYEPGSLIVSWSNQEDEVSNGFFTYFQPFDAVAESGEEIKLLRLAQEKNSELFTIFPHNRGAEAGVRFGRVSPVRLIIPVRAWSFRHNDRFLAYEEEQRQRSEAS